jgi:DNA-binding transcriptional MerR regulator
VAPPACGRGSQLRLPPRNLRRYDEGMKPSNVSIGVVAKQTGCTVPTIRYYEEIGLLPPAARTESGQRHYGEATQRRLRFIRRCRDFGFSIEQVRELVALHLAEVRRKLDELKALEASLDAFVCSCDTACAGGAALDCTILEDLAVPAEQPRATAAPTCCPG